jgi:hypothetical protein
LNFWRELTVGTGHSAIDTRHHEGGGWRLRRRAISWRL